MNDIGKSAFQFFNEVGIIQQLASTMFNNRLPHGVHISHFSILNHMVRLGDGKTPLNLAKAFQVTKGNITNSLSVLEKKEFISIEPHETDGRSKVVFLTDKGRAFQQEAIQSLAPAIVALHEKIDWQRVAKLTPELQRIREILDENRDI